MMAYRLIANLEGWHTISDALNRLRQLALYQFFKVFNVLWCGPDTFDK